MRVAVSIVLVLLAAGCGGESGDGDGLPAGTETATSSGADYEVFASEFAFAPPFLVVERPGAYTLSLRNDGNVPHNLTIKGVAKTPNVEPGKTVTLKVTLKRGSYEYFCSIGDHAERGMDGTLNVLVP